MRSIRRSLLGYLLLLLAVGLGAVGLLVDRFANGAIRQREASESERIEQTFKVREIEAKVRLDAALLAETKAKAIEAQRTTGLILGQPPDFRRGPRLADGPPVRAPEDESREYRIRSQLLPMGTTHATMATALAIAAVEPRRAAIFGPHPSYPGAPGWVAFDAPNALVRIQDAIRKAFEDDAGYLQITVVGTVVSHPGRSVAHVHTTRVRESLPLDSGWLEQTSAEWEPRIEDVDVPGLGLCRRVVTATSAGRPLLFGVWLPPPALPIPFPNPNAPAYRPAFNRPDLVLRLVVQIVRPYSELDARLAADQHDRDLQLSRVREETRMELQNLRARLILIGTGTFAALVLGGWFIVARGLSPLHKLSDAVSLVSEKDFHLAVDPTELGRELAPIHARITQTLTLLQRAFAREKQAVADISHELRTPIASLLATIDVALRKDRTPEQYREALKECRLISKQLGQLVERIMTLASLDAGNDHTQVTRTDAVELAGGCVAVIRPLAAANTITVSAHLPAELALETDPAKLREVLMNLLHNAVEYNKPGGTIDLTTRRAGNSAVFEVRDTGIGMSAEVRERIFERFYRADASRQATGIHAGLGLAIVKEYVARLNGQIAVESEPGAGTTFRVTLPLAPASADTPAIVPADRAKPRSAVAASS